MSLIIDCHGHYTTAPRQLEEWRNQQIAGIKDASVMPKASGLKISDDDIRETIVNNQLRLMKERGNDLTLDHVMPRHRGGQHTWDNVVAACRACNHRKGGRTLAESHMTLLRQPKRPPATPTYLYSSYVRAGERAWAKFIGMDESAAAS